MEPIYYPGLLEFRVNNTIENPIEGETISTRTDYTVNLVVKLVEDSNKIEEIIFRQRLLRSLNNLRIFRVVDNDKDIKSYRRHFPYPVVVYYRPPNYQLAYNLFGISKIKMFWGYSYAGPNHLSLFFRVSNNIKLTFCTELEYFKTIDPYVMDGDEEDENDDEAEAETDEDDNENEVDNVIQISEDDKETVDDLLIVN